ncbi:ABC transporter CDR4 [Purpureocillium lavendulum]|uniref:ABC transporter CDR4 n=1 Tax=Purpureocillium lavendulum TaxID=1247861 RepID=A0AB34FUI6_9HYPO|nr:ABC transporter CDR4 [Purpureocillium lavendulum]
MRRGEFIQTAAQPIPLSTPEDPIERLQSPVASPVMASANHSQNSSTTPHTAPSSRRGSKASQTFSFATPGPAWPAAQKKRSKGPDGFAGFADENQSDDSPQKGGHSLRKRARVDYTFEHVDDDLLQGVSASGRRRRRTDIMDETEDMYDAGRLPASKKRGASLGADGSTASPSIIRRNPVRKNSEVQAYKDDENVQDTIEVGVSFSDMEDSDLRRASDSTSDHSPDAALKAASQIADDSAIVDSPVEHPGSSFADLPAAAQEAPVVDDQLIDPSLQPATTPSDSIQKQDFAITQPAESALPGDANDSGDAVQPTADGDISIPDAPPLAEVTRVKDSPSYDEEPSMQLLKENKSIDIVDQDITEDDFAASNPTATTSLAPKDESQITEATEVISDVAPIADQDTQTTARASSEKPDSITAEAVTDGDTETQQSLAPPTITISDTTTQITTSLVNSAGDVKESSLAAKPDEQETPAKSIEAPQPDLSGFEHADMAEIPLYSLTRLQGLLQGRYAHLSPYVEGERQSYPSKTNVTYEAELEERLAEVKAAKEKKEASDNAADAKDADKPSDGKTAEGQDLDEKAADAQDPDDNDGEDKDGDDLDADERASDDEDAEDNDDAENLDSNENGDVDEAGDVPMTETVTPAPADTPKKRSLVALSLEPSRPNELIPLPPTTDGTIPTKMVKPEDAPKLKHNSFSFKKIRDKDFFIEALKDYETMSTQDLYDVLEVVSLTMRDWQREYFEQGDIVLNEENAINQEIEDAKFLKKMRMNPDKDIEGSWPSVKQKGNNFKGRRKRYEDLKPYYELPEDKLAVAVYGKEPRADPNMIVPADPSQKEGVVTRSRASRTTVSGNTGRGNQQEALPAKRRRRAAVNIDYTPQDTSRSATPALLPRTVGRKRKAMMVDEAGNTETTPEVEEEPQPKPKRRRRTKAQMAQDRADAEAAAEAAAAAAAAAGPTSEPASAAKSASKPGRKRGPKRAIDEELAAFANPVEDDDLVPKQKRKMLTLKIPKAKTSSEPSSEITDNAESRPSTASSDSTSHTADSSYSFRPKRQKRFRDEPDEVEPVTPAPPKKRGKRAQAAGDARLADSATATPEASAQPASGRKLPKIKVVGKASEAHNGTPAATQPATTPAATPAATATTAAATTTPTTEGDSRPKDYDKMTKSEKMSASMKSRWANGNMAQAVEKRKATLAAKKAAQAAADSKVGIIAPKPKGKAVKKEAAAAAQQQPPPPPPPQQMHQAPPPPQQHAFQHHQQPPTTTEFIHHGLPGMGYHYQH